MPPRRPAHDVHVGIAEIAAVCDVKRKTGVQWHQRRVLPDPCGCRISRDKAWRLADILDWAPANRRRIRGDVVQRLQAGEDIGDLIEQIEARPA